MAISAAKFLTSRQRSATSEDGGGCVGGGDGCVEVVGMTAETAGFATSTTASARVASWSRGMLEAVAKTICTFCGKRCKNSSRKKVSSVAVDWEPSS